MSNTRKPKSAKELLASARLPERTVSICVRGDLVADIERLDAELKREVDDRATNGRLSTKSSRAKEIAEEIEAKRAEMSEATIAFRVRAMKPAAWREVAGRYRSKSGDLDVLALMGEAIPASTIEPSDLDADDWANLNENTAPAELGKLIDAVWELNTQGVDVPKSRLASVINRQRAGD